MSLASSILLIVGFILIYAILVEVFSVLFRLTGLTKEKSKFQAVSMLTSCGYTTSESEIITSDRVRRKIATGAMFTGYAFSVIIVSLFINLFINLNLEQLSESVWYIVSSISVVLLFFIASKIPFIRRNFDKLIETIAIRIFRKNNKENVITLLDNYGKDEIVEVLLNNVPDIIANKRLIETNLKKDYNINILMYKRRGKVLDVTRNTIFTKGDVLVVFGRSQNIKDVFSVKSKEIEKVLEKTSIENDIQLIDNYDKDAMAEVKINRVPEFLMDKTLVQSKIKDLYDINVMMIKRNDMPIMVSRDTTIKLYDSIVVFGPYDNIKRAFLENYK